MSGNMQETVIVKSKKAPNSILSILRGVIVWKDKESFGFEFDIGNSTFSSVLYYDEWEVVNYMIK